MRSAALTGTVASAAMAIAVMASVGPSVARAQAKDLRVGAIGNPSSPAYAFAEGAFLKGMAHFGYERGRNFTFEHVAHSGSTQAEYDRGYRQLVGRKVDIFVAFGLEELLKAAIAVAGTRPIVMIAVNWDPLARGYVRSLARPGGNITGVTFREVDLTAKRFQLLMEMVPDLRAAMVFWDRLSADQWPEAQVAAARLGLRIQGIAFEGAPPYDFERGLARAAPEYRGGLITLGSPNFAYPERRSLPDFTLRHRIRSMFVVRQYVDQGGLVSYGPDYARMFARAAYYVDRIAKGAKPADLPIEQPTEFELVVNLRSARALGIAIPESVMLRATRLIE